MKVSALSQTNQRLIANKSSDRISRYRIAARTDDIKLQRSLSSSKDVNMLVSLAKNKNLDSKVTTQLIEKGIPRVTRALASKTENID